MSCWVAPYLNVSTPSTTHDLFRRDYVLEQPIGFHFPESGNKVFLFTSRAWAARITLKQTMIAVWINPHDIILVSRFRHSSFEDGDGFPYGKICIPVAPERQNGNV